MNGAEPGDEDLPARTGHPGHIARRTALDILYQADVMQADPRTVLAEWRSLGREVPDAAAEMVAGVAERIAELDRMIGDRASGWTVTRMAVVDRNILRLACYELQERTETPVAVVIDEAVEAAKELSTEDSGRFVNGILGGIAEELRGST